MASHGGGGRPPARMKARRTVRHRRVGYRRANLYARLPQPVRQDAAHQVRPGPARSHPCYEPSPWPHTKKRTYKWMSCPYIKTGRLVVTC